jgi:hypothetical protein
LAGWLAYLPEPPPAPLMSTFCPGWRSCPMSRMPCSAMAPAMLRGGLPLRNGWVNCP